MSAVIFEVDSEVFNKTHHSRKEQWFTHLEWLEIVQTMFYLYTSSMAVLTLISRPKPTDILSTHLALLLFAAFGVFFYRDIIPLGTFTMKPMETGWLDWVRLRLLFVVGVLLPLTAPRRFEPLDRSKNLPPTAEQTASWLSFASWSFLDSTIKNAYSVPHLPYDDLPALADTDHVDNLVKVSFPHLDPGQNPAKSHHIFLGLMKTYRMWHIIEQNDIEVANSNISSLMFSAQEYFKLAFLLLLRTLANSFSPVTINQLLAYLEDGSQNTVIRPWVWIVALVIAPVASSMAMQGYIFVSRRLLVRTEGIITQLVFEHSLKIRLKEDTPSEGTIESGTTTVTTTPPYGSVSPVSHSTDSHPVDTEEELHETSDAAATSTQEFQDPGKAKATASKAQSNNVPASANTDSKSGENLVGKITNLVSTDLYNIVEGGSPNHLKRRA
ncbi:hypothetical protein FRB93_001035 [Tulasnella sp. JGI-2019a]|nr:hypothetical protein FRB93_001035 [Tulasnella sp. JGI-2019a]